MQSIRVTLFSGNPNQLIFISIPILNQADLTRRVNNLVIRHQSITRYLKKKNHVKCRELFQENGGPEIFFFPYSPVGCISLQMMSFGEVFFLRHPSYGFIFCFSPNAKTKLFTKTKTAFFLEEKGYPAGVNESASFFFSVTHISILVSEHGCIKANSDGEWILKGIEIAFLQKSQAHGKSIFVQRKNECVSPNRPLSENFGPVNLFQMNKKYIKVRCICNTPEFCYSAQFPVLSEQELEQEILQDKIRRLQRYGDRSHLYTSGPLEHCLLQEPNDQHMIMFPYGMGIDVPFGNVQGGRMFFSYYTDKSCPGCSLEKFKLTFFPPLFEPYENLQIVATKKMKEIFQKNRKAEVSFCGSTKATIFTSSRIKIVSCLSSEYQLVGVNVEMISTKTHGGWGVCFSCETINLANNPLPGPSGIESRESTTQVTATIFVPPGRQGEHTQKRRSPTPGSSGLGNRGTTTQATTTVFVPPGRQGKQTQKRRNHVPGPSDISFRPYSYGPYSYGPLPFYGSPIIPHPQTAPTVSSSPGQQGQQTQQRSRSPLRETSGVRPQVIRPTTFRPRAGSTAYVSTERQSQQTPYTQQRDIRNFALGPWVSSNIYPQHGPWPVSGGPYPYFYPEIGSFVGGSYPYGSPHPSYPHPSVRQDQWMPVFPPSFSAIRAPVAAFDPIRYEILVQEEDIGNSGREEEASASVPIGAVQQTSIWMPDKEYFSAAVPSQAQANNSDEDTDIDVEN